MIKFKRKGFTLVELLIVIVVIGVLSAMMMLSSTEAVSSAKASNVISNMRNLKTAMLSWYTDNIDRVKKKGSQYEIFNADGTSSQTLPNFTGSDAGKAEILKYLSNGDSSALAHKGSEKDGEYVIADVVWKDWYVYYKVGNDSRMKEKIASKAKSLGLLGASGIGNTPGEDVYKTQTYVLMPIMKLE